MTDEVSDMTANQAIGKFLDSEPVSGVEWLAIRLRRHIGVWFSPQRVRTLINAAGRRGVRERRLIRLTVVRGCAARLDMPLANRPLSLS